MASNSARRVRFSHDSESLMNPLPTVRVVFNIHLSPADLMVDSEVEFVKAPMRRPMRRLFGSLADLCASLDEDVKARPCDGCKRHYGEEHNWTEKENPEKPDEPEYFCESCEEESADESASSEEKEPEKLVECENCWCTTTQEDLESEDGCHECGLGPNSTYDGEGIGCDFCDRSYSDECDWRNAYDKLIWDYGLEDHPAADEWTMMCPACQENEDLVASCEEECDNMAEEYFQEKARREHPLKFNPVLDGILESQGSGCLRSGSKRLHSEKFNRVLDQILESGGLGVLERRGLPRKTIVAIRFQQLKSTYRDFTDIMEFQMRHGMM